MVTKLNWDLRVRIDDNENSLHTEEVSRWHSREFDLNNPETILEMLLADTKGGLYEAILFYKNEVKRLKKIGINVDR